LQRPGASLAALLVLGAACARTPCESYQGRRTMRYSLPYAGTWTVTGGDSLTLPDQPPIADRFRLRAVALDTATVVAGGACLLRGRLMFEQPRAETLAVRWFGQPEQAIVQGWPADLGPFGGVALVRRGPDSVRGSLLFDSRMGVQVPAGVTAQFTAARTVVLFRP
jgi:hypothetical protein